MVRRTKEEAQETRNQILIAAEQAFYERGVARTTLADIATLAGVTRGAIYWHFNCKAELVQAMLDSLHEPLEELARASESQDEEDPLGCTRELLVRVFRQIAIDPRSRRVNEILFHKCELTDETVDIRRHRIDSIHECHERIEASLVNMVRRQQMPEDLDTGRAAIALHAQVDGLIGLALLVPESFDLQNDAERWSEMILDMLRLSPQLRK